MEDNKNNVTVFVLKWGARVLNKDQYAMPNPVSVTDHLCKARCFFTAAEAASFKEENYLDCFTVVEVDYKEVLNDVQEVLAELEAQALADFKKAVRSAKRLGIDNAVLHQLVDDYEE